MYIHCSIDVYISNTYFWICWILIHITIRFVRRTIYIYTVSSRQEQTHPLRPWELRAGKNTRKLFAKEWQSTCIQMRVKFSNLLHIYFLSRVWTYARFGPLCLDQQDFWMFHGLLSRRMSQCPVAIESFWWLPSRTQSWRGHEKSQENSLEDLEEWGRSWKQDYGSGESNLIGTAGEFKLNLSVLKHDSETKCLIMLVPFGFKMCWRTSHV